MRLFGLIGYPLTQSFSKKYFEEKFEKEGLTDCRFENFPISSIELLKDLVESHQHLCGLAVTIPYKKQVMPFLSSAKEIPGLLNACNCIRVQSGKLFGYNTDHIGFEKSLVNSSGSNHKKALVLGNGGATAAVCFVLQRLGIGYQIVSRSLHANSTLTYKDLSKELMSMHTLIINTTPLGTFPDIDGYPPIPYEFITGQHFVYDLIYNPSETVFLKKAREQGAMIKNGEEMLVVQAEENWKIWNE